MLQEQFLNFLKYEKNYSERTIESYGADIRDFAFYLNQLDEQLSLIDADDSLIRSWIVTMMDKHHAISSVKRRLSSLKAFYKYLLRKELIKFDPTLKVVAPKAEKKIPYFLKEKEMDKILDGGFFEDNFVGWRDRTILEMFYLTGIRLSELINLSDGDVDLVQCQLKVTGKRNKQRIIPFGIELASSLNSYLKKREEVKGEVRSFFVKQNGESVTKGLVYSVVRRNLSKVSTLKKRSPHVLRHTFATSMLNHDANLEAVRGILGHESLATTEIYTHTTFEELKEVYRKAHPRE